MNYSDEHSIGDGLEWMAVWNQAMVQSEDLVTAATATATRAKEPPKAILPIRTASGAAIVRHITTSGVKARITYMCTHGGKFHWYETINVKAPAPHIWHIRLDRTDKRNAVSRLMLQEIVDCFDRIGTDPECRAVVLSGAGECFSAGMDCRDVSAIVKEGIAAHTMANIMAEHGDAEPTQPAHIPTDISRRGAHIRRATRQWQGSLNTIAECPVPVVAAIHGPCIGAGLVLALAADVRHCSADAYFSIREVRIGMAADMGSLQRVPKLMGNRSLARELAFTGRDMPAAEALAQGLVSAVTDGAG
ncbi:unnamed protein product, partial [Medioppia subpectinata]